MATGDVRATYEELAARGVPFEGPLTEQPWGTQAVFRDPDGNGLVLWESTENKKGAPRSGSPS